MSMRLYGGLARRPAALASVAALRHAVQTQASAGRLAYAPGIVSALLHIRPMSSQGKIDSSGTTTKPSPSAQTQSPAGGSSKPATEAVAATSYNPITWLKANKDRLGELGKRYGRLVIATYLGIYVVVLGCVFGLVKMRVIEGPSQEKVNNFINGWFIKRWILDDRKVSIPEGAVDFSTAWVLTKTTEPVRLVTTLAVVPTLARRLPPHVLAVLGVKHAVDEATKQ